MGYGGPSATVADVGRVVQDLEPVDRQNVVEVDGGDVYHAFDEVDRGVLHRIEHGIVSEYAKTGLISQLYLPTLALLFVDCSSLLCRGPVSS